MVNKIPARAFRSFRLLSFLLLAAACHGQSFTITTIVGSTPRSLYTDPFGGDGGPATAARLGGPNALAMDAGGNLYIADSGNNRVRKVSQQGIISTFAGSGSAAGKCSENTGCSGDGGLATAAAINGPSGLCIDSAGNVYMADEASHVIRKVDSNGIISTFAGKGTEGYSGDGGLAVNAEFTPNGLATDPTGNLYLSDYLAGVVRRISSNGIISTFAGSGKKDFAGDGGLATQASMLPTQVTLDGAGNVFIADSGHAVIRKVGLDGIITSVAGNVPLSSGSLGDGGPATSALFANPAAVAVDSAGNLFIADVNNNRIREVLSNGTVISVAGNGNSVYQGDGGLATNAGLQSPFYVLAVGDKIYVSDFGHNLVRLLTPGAPPVGPAPVISKGGIAPIFSTSQTIQGGSWISIYGSNLITGTTPVLWNGDYPLSLGGTTVTVGKDPVPLSYVSPTMINAFVPVAGVAGSVSVTVTSANGSGSSTTTFAQASPAFCLLGDGMHVAGIIVRSDGSGAFGGGTYDIMGPAGTSLGYPTMPAKTGDNIVLFGVGFGPTNPLDTIPLSGTTRASFPIDFVIGSTPLKPAFAGLSSPGIFQFNLVVPPGLGGGDLSLVATIIGVSTQKGVVIALQ